MHTLMNAQITSLVFTRCSNARAYRIIHEPDVCLPVCQTRGLWQNERNLCPHSIYQFYDKKNDWGDPFYLKFWTKLTLLERKRRFSIDIYS